MELTELQKKIIRTLACFTVLNRPLTLLELINYLDRSITLKELIEQLSQPILQQYLQKNNGYYQLKSETNLLEIRNTRYQIAFKKIKIAQRAVKFLKHFPWVRGIAIYSSLSLKNSQETSDIDLFFVTSKRRVWSTRFFINVVLKLLKLRPSQENTKNKLCISYLVAEDFLDLSKVNYDNDYYYYYLGPASFVFLYQAPTIKEKFIKTNQWIKEILPNWQPIESINVSSDLGKIKLLLEKILSVLSEKQLKKLQLKILPTKYLKSCDGKKVILDDNIIKLHDNDKRDLFNANFKKKIEQIFYA